MNTYGLRSIHTNTFNLRWDSNLTYTKKSRDIIVTSFRIHNLVLNVLGYIPGISNVSGCVRIATGVLICASVLKVGDRNAKSGANIGHLYDEALLTGITQIARGVIEAFLPFGWYINLNLDVIATHFNFLKEFENALEPDPYDDDCPYQEPVYPFPFWLLYLA